VRRHETVPEDAHGLSSNDDGMAAVDQRAEDLRVIIAGGGTGGHLFPGLAVAETLAERVRCRVVFVGSTRGIETRVLPDHGYPLRTLPVRALRGQGVFGLAASVVRLPASVASAWRIVGEVQPDLLIGVGGYASGPAVLAAWGRRVPTVLLEQNAHPGLTNRMLAHFADRICVAFPESARYFPEERTIETGNPVRAPRAAPRAGGEGGFSVLIFGGSAGARRLNDVGVEAMARVARIGPPPRIVHQTGESEVDSVRRRYEERGIEADVRAFIDDMGAAYAAADLVICRAGATTLAELAALGKPAILVPYPYAADDHQRKNAESLVARGAAIMMLDHELSAQDLCRAVEELRAEPRRLAAMAEAARAAGRPDAAERVVAVCLDLVRERRKRA
jgi:UDP-N-acetylglucosamine--N-acetylmuramyl-(pentapeptide) pyrophosphoryl-undecaprenol N-acetylglucosamine transferase